MTTATSTDAGIATIRSLFDAFANHDLAALDDIFAADATWNHRNNDRLGGIHRGSDGITAHLAESAQLTGSTRRAEPLAFMAGDGGRVSVLVQMRGTRPGGRSFDSLQMVLFKVESGRVRAVDQFIGDPAAAAAFWA